MVLETWNQAHAMRHSLNALPRLPLIGQMVDNIDRFERECEAESYTDTGQAWDLLYQIRAELRCHVEPNYEADDSICTVDEGPVNRHNADGSQQLSHDARQALEGGDA